MLLAFDRTNRSESDEAKQKEMKRLQSLYGRWKSPSPSPLHFFLGSKSVEMSICFVLLPQREFSPLCSESWQRQSDIITQVMGRWWWSSSARNFLEWQKKNRHIEKGELKCGWKNLIFGQRCEEICEKDDRDFCIFEENNVLRASSKKPNSTIMACRPIPPFSTRALPIMKKKHQLNFIFKSIDFSCRAPSLHNGKIVEPKLFFQLWRKADEHAAKRNCLWSISSTCRCSSRLSRRIASRFHCK